MKIFSVQDRKIHLY